MYLLMTSLKKATSYFGSFLFYYFYYFIFLFLFVFILNLPALKALIRIFFLILWGKRSLVNIFDMQRFHKTKCLLMNSLICFTPCRNECYIHSILCCLHLYTVLIKCLCHFMLYFVFCPCSTCPNKHTKTVTMSYLCSQILYQTQSLYGISTQEIFTEKMNQ